MDSQSSAGWHARTLRSWQLAILRFALTRDHADRLAVLAIAGEIDAFGKPAFNFFRKTSAELCSAVLQRADTSEQTLRQFLTRVDDGRLRCTLAAALDVKPREPAASQKKANVGAALWQGLSSRGGIQH